jgi:quercetin dioxygenase-like cupin family protein
VGPLAIGRSGRCPRDDLAASRADLGTFDAGTITVGSFSGESPWERHTDSDEYLHVLDGEVDVTLLTDDERFDVNVPAGSIFVVPRGAWHKQNAPGGVTVLVLRPSDHGPVSFAEDPRQES